MLLLRQTTQFSILSLLGPWFGVWWPKGNLASSVVLDRVSLTDPFILLQSLASGHIPGQAAITGAVIVFYFLVGKHSPVRMNVVERAACTDCDDCFRVCPELHVIIPVLKPGSDTDTSLILDSDCTNCGRCIDVCDEKVFRFSTRSG